MALLERFYCDVFTSEWLEIKYKLKTYLVEKNNMGCPLVILTGDKKRKYQLNAALYCINQIGMKSRIMLFSQINIARSEQSSHTPGGSHQRL